MRVEQLGEGVPEVAVVGGIHGDEPCGVRAVEALLEASPDVQRPVKCIVANERAIDRGVRYVDEDLNRAFPGDPGGNTHESRLAAALRRELRDCVAFSMHSTRSYDRPFALVDGTDSLARSIAPHLSVESVVDVGSFTEGRLIAHADVVEAECGLQRSEDAAENARRLARQFLGATGALPSVGHPRRDEPLPVYRLRRMIPKERDGEHAVQVSNFARVAAGEPFAATDGDEIVAEEPFYPVLLSADGYESVFGYAAEMVGHLEA